MMTPLRGLGLINDLSKRKVKVYNVETKTLLKECETVTAASNYSGLDRKRIATYITNKSRYKSDKLGCVITFR